jgi:dipeptidyl aminopeptidase/acylaminoacyl peptidase
MIKRWWWSTALLAIGCAQGDWRGGGPPPPELEGVRRPELVAFTPEDDLSATPSPDGRYLVFASEQNGNLDVWVRDFGTNSIYPLTIASPTDDFDPQISPDGKLLAFVSRRDDAKGDVFLAEGFDQEDDPERLTDEKTSDRQPVFAPDGKKIYFTSATGVGSDFITELDLETRERKPISPTPGFEPDLSIDGRWLIYTAPAGEGGRPAPHLVAMRLSDSATRALTRHETPEGFARFVPGASHAIVYVRFPDDDDGDGLIDPNDHASLWRLDLDLDALFERNVRPKAPFPLTDGSEDELFPRIANGSLYFTQGSLQQDILRLPASGMFPRYPEPAQYFELAQTLDEPRKRWFAYRCA